MTGTTSKLGLTTYKLPDDVAGSVDDYINAVSGSTSTANLGIIDRFATETSASITSLATPNTKTPVGLISGSITLGYVSPLGINATGSLVLGIVSPLGIGTTGSLTFGYVSGCGLTLSSGSIKIETGTGLTLSSGSIALALSGVTAGSYTAVYVDTYGRVTSGSVRDVIKKSAYLPLNTSASLTTADKNYIRIPAEMDLWYLAEVGAACSGSSYSGSPTFTVSKISGSSPDSATTSMLSTNLTIGEGEFDSKDATVAAVISTTASSVRTGDRIKVATTASGSSVTFAGVELTFRNF